MENLYVTFTVQVCDSKYSYSGRHANAEVIIQVPRQVLKSIDPGNLLIGVMQAALANFDAPPTDEDED